MSIQTSIPMPLHTTGLLHSIIVDIADSYMVPAETKSMGLGAELTYFSEALLLWFSDIWD